jgi:hypothetical protein
MSTILETLKKLEEDKRLLEKDSDLKELVLQEDLKPLVRNTLKFTHKNFMALALVLAGIIIGLALVWGFQSSTRNEVAYFPQGLPAQKPQVLRKKWSEPTVGIPLSNIPEQRQFYEKESSENFPPATETFVPPPIRKIREPIAEPKVLPQDVNEIRDLIQKATLEAKEPVTYAYPEKPTTHGISIPNLKVKGIIFFSPGSSSNHIFVSTLESNNQKVRVNDRVQSATLTHIAVNRVVFSYQGENVHLRIGE